MRRCVAVLALIFAQAAFPAVVPRVSFEELAQEAEFIVHGRVADSWVAWDDRRLFLWTHYRLEVFEPLKGPGGPLLFSEPGGTLDGMTMTLAGAVQFRPGEELVLFLYRTPTGYLRTCGYQQGKYSVVTGRAGEKRVRTNLAGMALVETGARRATSIASLDRLPLDQFKARIRALAGGR